MTKAIKNTVATTEAKAFATLAATMSKSDMIRQYAADGHSRAAIATHLNIRYQHVRNVLTQPLKRVAKEVVVEAKAVKTPKAAKATKKVAAPRKKKEAVAKAE